MYASLEDMCTRFGDEEMINVSRQGEPAETADADAVDAALGDATELIDSYVAARYAVPLSPVPSAVMRWCADIALYYLYGNAPTKGVRQGYEDALSGLREVAKGTVTLQSSGAETAAPVESGGGDIQTAGADRLFTMDSLRGY